jgi:hypothetical protein
MKFPTNVMPVKTYNNTHLRTHMKWRQWRFYLRIQLLHQVRNVNLSWDRHMEMTTIQLSTDTGSEIRTQTAHISIETAVPVSQSTQWLECSSSPLWEARISHYENTFYFFVGTLKEGSIHKTSERRQHVTNVLRLFMVGKSMLEEILQRESYKLLSVH